jgi:hypothetical protein
LHSVTIPKPSNRCSTELTFEVIFTPIDGTNVLGFRRSAIRDRTRSVARPRLWLMISGLCALGCGPNRADCTAPHADFLIELELRDKPLPSDTVVHVTYGGSGMEDYSLAEQNTTHEVVFCHPRTPDGCAALDAGPPGAAGAPGADDSGVAALCCELWTGGFAKVEVSASGLATMTYNLAPLEHECTVSKTIVLDSPDGG